MGNEDRVVREGEFDEDGALHISGIAALASTTQPGWHGASFDGAGDAPETRRAHVTCPHCASTNDADAEVCWNCNAAL